MAVSIINGTPGHDGGVPSGSRIPARACGALRPVMTQMRRKDSLDTIIAPDDANSSVGFHGDVPPRWRQPLI